MNKVSMQYVTLHFNLSPCVFNKVEIGFLGPNTKIEVSGDSFVLDLEGDESLKVDTTLFYCALLVFLLLLSKLNYIF